MVVLGNAIDTYQPVALLYNNELTETAEKIIALIKGAAELPRYNAQEITLIAKPQCPDKEDYQSDLEAYNLHIKSGHYSIGILLGNKEFTPVYFSKEKPKLSRTNGQTVTAKEVQAAIKSGTATPDLLQAEINRIKQREKRAEELDIEKVQLKVHNDFSEFTKKTENNTVLTAADMTGAKLIIFQSLDYHAKQEVVKTLLTDKGKRTDDTNKDLYERFSKLSESEFAYLVRMAVCSKSDSKYPRMEAGYFLYQMATEAGIPVSVIEDAQKQKRIERKEKQELKVKELKKKLDTLKKK